MGNVEIMIFLVHERTFVKYPGPGPGITILSILGIWGIWGLFGFRWALAAGRPPGILPKSIDLSQNVEK